MFILLDFFERHPILSSLFTVYGLITLTFQQQLMFSLFPWYIWILMGLFSIRYLVALFRMNKRDQSLEADVPSNGVLWLDGILALILVSFIGRILWWMFSHWSDSHDAAHSFVMLSGSALAVASMGGFARLCMDMQRFSAKK